MSGCLVAGSFNSLDSRLFVSERAMDNEADIRLRRVRRRDSVSCHRTLDVFYRLCLASGLDEVCEELIPRNI